MKRLKEKMLEDNQLSTPSPTHRPTASTPPITGNFTPSTHSPTGNSTLSTSSSTDAYIYGVGVLFILAIGVCIFFTFNTFQAANKKKNQGSTTKTASYALDLIKKKPYTINE